MTVIPIYRPYVFLRCKKCSRKTGHVLINTATIRKGEMEETYECQECGETKRIYELISLMEAQDLTVQELEENVKEKQVVVELLESKKKDLEKKLKEPRKKKNSKELMTGEAAAGTQQPENTETQSKSEEKKKRRFF